jgi:hypothetical protein
MEATDNNISLFDNLAATRQIVADHIINNMPVALSQNSLEELRLMSSGESTRDYIRIEFRSTLQDGSKLGIPASCELCITFFDSFGSNTVVDAEGNWWGIFEPEIQVSWPTWGSANLEVAKFRLDLMTAVAKLGESTRELFPSRTMKMLHTASAIRESEAKKLERANHLAATSLVHANRNRMRVGLERQLSLSDSKSFDALPEGTWNVETEDGKSYTFVKNADGKATLTRLS